MQPGIATFFCVIVNPREGPIPGVHGDGSDAIAARREEGFRIAPGLQIPADIQIGMAKVSKLLFVVREQETGDRFAAHDGFLKVLETRGV